MATLMSMMMGTFLFLLLGGLLIYVYMTRVRTSRSKFGLGASDMSLGFNDFGKRNKVDMIFGVRDTIRQRTQLMFGITGLFFLAFYGFGMLPALQTYFMVSWIHPVSAWVMWHVPLFLAVLLVSFALFPDTRIIGDRPLLYASAGYFLYVLWTVFFPMTIRQDGTVLVVNGLNGSTGYLIYSFWRWIFRAPFQPTEGVFFYQMLLGKTLGWYLTFLVTPAFLMLLVSSILYYYLQGKKELKESFLV